MARENVSVIERGLERTDAYVRDARSQVDAGVASPSDVLTAQAQRARQSVRVVQARNAAASAQLELARLIGAPPGQSIVTTTAVSAPMNGIAAVSEQSADALIARALQGRSERTSLTERRTGFQASAVAALANRKPWIGGALAVEPASPNSRYIPRSSDWNTSWELGVNLTWPLFDGGKAKANYAAATAQADGVEARIADFDAMVGSDIRQRLLDIDSGRAALTASEEAVTAATEARRVLEERYRAGVATSTDVLDAQVSLLEAELERTNLAASLRLSEARLLRALGGL
jgi:outer membrane protein TolC